MISGISFFFLKFKIPSLFPGQVGFWAEFEIRAPGSKLNFSPGRKFPGRVARPFAEPWGHCQSAIVKNKGMQVLGGPH